MKIALTSTTPPGTRRVRGAGEDSPLVGLPADAFDDRIAIVGTAGSGKTYAAKGFVERLLESGARVAIVDPLGVWWGLRASADGSAPGYPVIVFGGKHADVPITSDMGVALGRIVAREALACVVDLSDLGSSAARRRFMAAFAEAIYETNEEPLHLVLDETDLWAPQRPIKGWEGLLGHIEEIVRRGRVPGFIPWLITQRPAVVHKDVLSQADILIAMKLTASQDRDAIGAWIEGQADRQEGKRILADLPRLHRGEGYLWAPGHDLLERVAVGGDFDPVLAFLDHARLLGRALLRGVEDVARRDVAASPLGLRISDDGIEMRHLGDARDEVGRNVEGPVPVLAVHLDMKPLDLLKLRRRPPPPGQSERDQHDHEEAQDHGARLSTHGSQVSHRS